MGRHYILGTKNNIAPKVLVVTLYYSLVTIISLPTELKLKMQHLDKMTTLEIKHKNILLKKLLS